MTLTQTFVRRARVLAIVLLPAVSCTCANQVYQREYTAAIEDGSDAYRHAGGNAAVRADAGELLRGQRFEIDDAASTTRKLQTKWREDGEQRTRAILELDDDGAGTRVKAIRSDETLSPPRYDANGRERQTELEAAVVRRLAPVESKDKKDAQLVDHPFELPAHVIAGETARVLEERGSFVGVHAESEPMYSEWTETVDRSARTRYAVKVVAIDPDRRRLEIQRERERMIPGGRAWTPGPSRRDLDLELELQLVDRRDPVAAAAIRTTAEHRARAAYDEAIERGAPSCGI